MASNQERIRRTIRQVIAEAKAEEARVKDRHRTKPTSIRLPDDLHQWLRSSALRDSIPFRRAMVEALQVARLLRERGGADWIALLEEVRRDH